MFIIYLLVMISKLHAQNLVEEFFPHRQFECNAAGETYETEFTFLQGLGRGFVHAEPHRIFFEYYFPAQHWVAFATADQSIQGEKNECSLCYFDNYYPLPPNKNHSNLYPNCIEECLDETIFVGTVNSDADNLNNWNIIEFQIVAQTSVILHKKMYRIPKAEEILEIWGSEYYAYREDAHFESEIYTVGSQEYIHAKFFRNYAYSPKSDSEEYDESNAWKPFVTGPEGKSLNLSHPDSLCFVSIASFYDGEYPHADDALNGMLPGFYIDTQHLANIHCYKRDDIKVDCGQDWSFLTQTGHSVMQRIQTNATDTIDAPTNTVISTSSTSTTSTSTSTSTTSTTTTSSVCKNDSSNPAILATSEVSDFTFSGGAAAEGQYVIHDIVSGDPDGVGVIVVNECITSHWHRIVSVDFHYKYAYGCNHAANIRGCQSRNYAAMELRLFQQSNPSNYLTIYESDPLDSYSYYSYYNCRGQQDLSCFSPLIVNNMPFLGLDIVGNEYQFELIVTNNDKNVHVDRDSLYIAVNWQECVTADICDVEARVAVVDARYDAVKGRMESLIAQIQGIAAEHAFDGHADVVGDAVVDNVYDTFDFWMFRFTNTEILLLAMNILTIFIVLCSCTCWKFKNQSVRYSKATADEKKKTMKYAHFI